MNSAKLVKLCCGTLLCATALPPLAQPGDEAQAEATEPPASVTAKERSTEANAPTARKEDDEQIDASEAGPEASLDPSAADKPPVAEVFVPSEDISEDIDVPFPVDI